MDLSIENTTSQMKKQFLLKSNHPIVENHTVYGQPLLPGLAYIDMIYQLFSEHGFHHTNLKLRKLSIYNPLTVNKDCPVQVSITCDRFENGIWTIKVSGQKYINGNLKADTELLYVSAEMSHVKATVFNEKIDVDALKKNAKQIRPLQEDYAVCSENELVHSGLMKAQGEVYDIEDGVLMDLSIGNATAYENAEFLFNPTLIDGSGVGALQLLAAQSPDSQDLFLPLSYESFSASGPLLRHCITRIKHSSVYRKNDLIYLTYEYFDEVGHKIAELENFTCKLVRDPRQINPELVDEQITTVSEKVPTKAQENTTVHEDTYPDMEAFLKNVVASQLGCDSSKVNGQEGYYDLGLNSAKLLETVKIIEEKLDTSLAPTLLFEYATIGELAEHLTESYPMALENGMENQQSTSENQAKETPEPIHEEVQSKEGGKDQEKTCTDIAIISVSGRYPKAKNIEEFWKNLQEGKDCIEEVPASRWDHSQYFEKKTNKPGKTPCKWGGFINEVDCFDPLFFNTSPREADIMDPQVRIFLEVAWNLFESIGLTRADLKKQYKTNVGVFVGAMSQSYQLINSNIIEESATSLSSFASIANRVSYFFDFQGPSIAVDTMCSSSLMAIHTAIESLLKGDCKLAIAGGANLLVHPKKYIGSSLGQLLGSTSDSRSFSNGDGYLPAEGVGAVLLKPLNDAISDGDHIMAVVKSTNINHGGKSGGFSIPNPNAQFSLIRKNFEKSNIDPRTISYVECAANGSALGDPIELVALGKAFKQYTKDTQFCAIGSVKTNMGHAEAASGISQFTKVVLQLMHKKIVPNPIKMLNPKLDLASSPFYLQDKLVDWKQIQLEEKGQNLLIPRRATVSSFGAGGSNVHIILEEYNNEKSSEVKPKSLRPPSQILILSAKSPARLKAMVVQSLKHLSENRNLDLAHIAHTLQKGREAMECRLAVIAKDIEEFMASLKEYLIATDEKRPFSNGYLIFRENANVNISTEFGNLKTEDPSSKTATESYDLEKVAHYWSQGGEVPWEDIDYGTDKRIIPWPTYPFDRKRCWLDMDEVNLDDMVIVDGSVISVSANTKEASGDGPVVDIVTELLKLISDEIDWDAPMTDYGLDSIITMQLLQKLQSDIDPDASIERINECHSLNDLIRRFPVVKTEGNDKEVSNGKPSKANQFPELVKLNQARDGKPVFWIHPGGGGVEIYGSFSQTMERPFYGIQARGWNTDRQPLVGVGAMAAFYVQIIMSVQPQGPYDIGGYSLGGVLSYEVARQLQELGQKVDSIIMMDSLDTEGLQRVRFSLQSEVLQIINMRLLEKIKDDTVPLEHVLVHRDEIDRQLNGTEMLKDILTHDKVRGKIEKDDWRLWQDWSQREKFRKAHIIDNFQVFPLIDRSVKCYYFRNSNGLFFGDLQPFFAVDDSEALIDGYQYWKEWKEQFENFEMIDLIASNHMSFIKEPNNIKIISEFCASLYANNK